MTSYKCKPWFGGNVAEGWKASVYASLQRRVRGVTAACTNQSWVELVSLKKRIDLHVVFLQIGAHYIEGFVHGVGKLHAVIFFLIDHAPANHGFEIQNFMPILPSVNQNQSVLGHFSGLRQGHHFPELVHRAEAAGKDDQSFEI